MMDAGFKAGRSAKRTVLKVAIKSIIKAKNRQMGHLFQTHLPTHIPLFKFVLCGVSQLLLIAADLWSEAYEARVTLGIHLINPR